MDKEQTKKKINIVPAAAAAVAAVATPVAICAVEETKKNKTVKLTSTKATSAGASKNVKIWRKDQDEKNISKDINGVGIFGTSDKEQTNPIQQVTLDNTNAKTWTEEHTLGRAKAKLEFNESTKTCKIVDASMNEVLNFEGWTILDIPAEVNGYKLTEIVKLNKNDLNGINFLNATNLEVIHDHALENSGVICKRCPNSAIDLSNTKLKRIGKGAFENWGLDSAQREQDAFVSIKLPSTIEEIADDAFGGNHNNNSRNIDILGTIYFTTTDVDQISKIKLGTNWLPDYESFVKCHIAVPSGTKAAYEKILNLNSCQHKDGYDVIEYEPDDKYKVCISSEWIKIGNFGATYAFYDSGVSELVGLDNNTQIDTVVIPATAKASDGKEYKLTKIGSLISPIQIPLSETFGIDFTQAVNLEIISENAFKSVSNGEPCNSRHFKDREINFSNTKLTKIGKNAFDGVFHGWSPFEYHDNINNIRFPSTIREVEENAFGGARNNSAYSMDIQEDIYFTTKDLNEIAKMKFGNNWLPDYATKRTHHIYVPVGTKAAYEKVLNLDNCQHKKGYDIVERN